MKDEGGDDHRHQGGDEDFLDDPLGGDHSFDPQHDGGDVADGGEGAATVGGDDDECSVDEPVVAVVHQLAEHHDHHDARGEVVEDGREDECHEGDAPQELALVRGGHHVAHKVETAVLVNNLHDGHGTHQEEERLARLAKVLLEYLAKFFQREPPNSESWSF